MNPPRTPSRARARGSTRARPAHPPVRAIAVLSPRLAHLALTGLRSYRVALESEQSNLAYWRRVVHLRLDVVRADTADSGLGGTRGLDAEHLREVLSDERIAAAGAALVAAVPPDDLPPLPQLAELWARHVEVDDEGGLAGLERDLLVADGQLGDYGAAVHDRLVEATNELIARYRTQPALCLTALPLAPSRSGRA